MLGVLKTVLFANNNVPPVDALYQSTVLPAATVAPMVTEPDPHLEALSAEGAAGTAFTVAVTAVLVAEIHPVVVFLAWA